MTPRLLGLKLEGGGLDLAQLVNKSKHLGSPKPSMDFFVVKKN